MTPVVYLCKRMLVVPLTVIFTTACSSSSSVPEPVTGVQDPGLHAIMTQNIERHLERIDGGNREDVVGLIQSAQGLQLSADIIMSMRSSLGLSPDAATVFSDRATQLKGFAAELETVARAGDLADVRDVVGQINGSCGGCHNLFRR